MYIYIYIYIYDTINNINENIKSSLQKKINVISYGILEL